MSVCDEKAHIDCASGVPNLPFHFNLSSKSVQTRNTQTQAKLHVPTSMRTQPPYGRRNHPLWARDAARGGLDGIFTVHTSHSIRTPPPIPFSPASASASAFDWDFVLAKLSSASSVDLSVFFFCCISMLRSDPEEKKGARRVPL